MSILPWATKHRTRWKNEVRNSAKTWCQLVGKRKDKIMRTEVHKQRLRDVLEQINNHPETWRQEDWHCNSSHCVGGWAQLHRAMHQGSDLDTEDPEVWASARQEGAEWLGLSDTQHHWLFQSDRTLDELNNSEAVLSAMELGVPGVLEAILNLRDRYSLESPPERTLRVLALFNHVFDQVLKISEEEPSNA